MKKTRQGSVVSKRVRTKTGSRTRCPARKNHQLSLIADYLLNSIDQEDEVCGIRVRSVYLTEEQAPRSLANWSAIFTQMKDEHYLVPTGEPNQFYVFTDKREGTAFAQKLKQRPKKSAAA
jgi:hypothetical protein